MEGFLGCGLNYSTVQYCVHTQTNLFQYIEVKIKYPEISKPHVMKTLSSRLFTGTVTDGEFSSLRTQGETRPLHIWQLVHDARQAVSKMSKDTMLDMLIALEGENINVCIEW